MNISISNSTVTFLLQPDSTLLGTIMQNLDDVLAAVAAQTGTIESMKTFIAGLEQAIRDAVPAGTLTQEQQDKIDAIFAGVNANSTAIGNAIDNNPDTV